MIYTWRIIRYEGYLNMKNRLIITLLASAICALLVANYRIYSIPESPTEAAKQEAPKGVVAPKPDNAKKTHVNSIDATQLSSDDAVHNALKNAQIAANELRRLENRKRHLEKISADKKAKEDYYRSFAKSYDTDIFEKIPFEGSVFKEYWFNGRKISENDYEHTVIVNSPISAQDFTLMAKHTFARGERDEIGNNFSIELPYYKFGGEYTSMIASNCYILSGMAVSCAVENGSLDIFENSATKELDYYMRVGEDYSYNSTGRPDTIYLFKDNQILMYNNLDSEFKRIVPEPRELSDDMDY